MAKLFIANGTYQHRYFEYRVLEQTTIRRLHIPAKQQSELPEDLENDGLRYVIKQLETAGGVPVSDINAITGAYSLVYMVARPISTEKINEVGAKDLDVRQNIAADKTEQVGMTAFALVAQTNPDKLQSTTLDVTQMQDTNDEEKAGGVDVELTVSKKAGRRKESARRAG